MNRWPKLLVVPFLVLFLFAGGAMADNITIWDGNGIGENDTYGLEDGETEPGMDQSQVWDLEAFLLEGTMLTMVGGYDFESGEESGSKTFYSGDLFIGRDVKYGKDAATASVGSKKNDFMSNVFGYEYAIDFNFVPDTNSYAVYKINQNTQVTTSYYYDYGSPDYFAKQASNPVALKDPSSIEIVGDAERPLAFWNEGGKYYLSVDIGFLIDEGFAGEEFYTHFTMECGNDNLMGKGVTPAPEPATMLLLGTGLIGLAGASRKKFKK